jgi:hypothetical protein
VFRIFDGRPLTLAIVMATLFGAIFAVPIAWYLFTLGLHNGASTQAEALMPVVVMATFGLVIVAVPVGWYVLGEFTYGRGDGPRN